MDSTGLTIAAVTDDLSLEPTARAHADILEYRMDLTDAPLDALDSYTGVTPILVTNRVEDEGGNAPPGDTRLDTLQTAVRHDAVHGVDIEASTLGTDRGRTVARTAREAAVTVVASTHDFDGTPPPEDLKTSLTRTTRLGDIGKVAVTANDVDDALTLLSATRTAVNNGRNVATIAMGRPGCHTRIVAPLYGSQIAYAPLHGERTTAPGQFDLPTLTSMLETVR